MAGLGKRGLRIPKTIKLFIGGEFPRTESGRSFSAMVHGSEEIYANLCQASRKDFRNAVTAAQGALHGWESKSAFNRGQILYRMAEMAEGKRQEFAEILTTVMGLSAEAADSQIDAMIDAFVYYAGFSDKYQQMIGAVNPVSGPHHCFTTPEPVGVVNLILGENAKLEEIVGHIASIVVSGNALVVLLPENGAVLLAPLAEVFATSDLPKGVINLLTGHLSELAAQIGSHMEVQCLSYQGDDAELLGELKTLATENMKRVVARQRTGLALENLLSYIEYKTVWHPIGY